MKIQKLYLLIATIFLSLQAFSQNEEISIGVKLLPGISNSDQRLINTSWKFSIGAGIQFVTNFNNVVGIESGIYYKNVGYNSDVLFTDMDGTHLGKYRLGYNYNYLNIPILLRLNIHSFYFGLGTNINVFVSGKVQYPRGGLYVHGDLVKSEKIEDAKTVVIDPSLNWGYQFNINNKFGINLEGRFSYSVNGISEEYSDMQLINLGLGVGFCYFITPME